MHSPNRIAHIAELHQLRGLAAILVFVYHSMHSGRAFLGHSGWPVALNPVSAAYGKGTPAFPCFSYYQALSWQPAPLDEI